MTTNNDRLVSSSTIFFTFVVNQLLLPLLPDQLSVVHLVNLDISSRAAETNLLSLQKKYPRKVEEDDRRLSAVTLTSLSPVGMEQGPQQVNVL